MTKLRESFFGGKVIEDTNEHFRVIITPDVAKEMLQKNISNNRTLRPRQIAAYACDMSADKWNTGAPNAIIFTHDGELIDGQHRLNAVIKSGTATALNVTVLARDVPLTGIDRGIKRTPKDVFRMSDDVNISGVLISALKMWATYKLENFQPGVYDQNFIITDEQLKETYWDADEYWNIVSTVAGRGTDHPISNRAPAFVAAMAAIKCGTSKEDLADFFAIVNTGLPLESRDAQKSSAAFAARNYILSIIGSNEGKHKATEIEGKLEEYIFLFVKGIQRKRPITKATWRYTKQYGENVRHSGEGGAA